MIAVEKLRILLFKLHLASLQVSLISLERKIFLASFRAESIKILTLEWPVMFALKSKHLNPQDFITNFSLHFKVLTLKCLLLFLNQVSLWPILQNKSKTKSKSMPSVEEKQQNKNNKNMGLIWPLIFLISIFVSS